MSKELINKILEDIGLEPIRTDGSDYSDSNDEGRSRNPHNKKGKRPHPSVTKNCEGPEES